MVNAAVLGVWFWMVAAGFLAWLVRGGYSRKQDRIGWVGVALLAVGGLSAIVGTFGASVQANDIGVFLATFLSLVALTVGVVYFVRRNRKPFDTEPLQRNFVPGARTVHAWGTYSAETVAAKRRRVF